MRDIEDMIRIVVSKMYYRDIKITGTEWINEHRNYLIKTEGAGIYVLKHSPQWKMAGVAVPELGKGAGMTFNLKAYLELSLLPEKPYMMFGFPESDHIYYQTWDEFKRLSEETVQNFNGEEVRVILTKSLKRF